MYYKGNYVFIVVSIQAFPNSLTTDKAFVLEGARGFVLGFMATIVVGLNR